MILLIKGLIASIIDGREIRTREPKRSGMVAGALISQHGELILHLLPTSSVKSSAPKRNG